MRPARRPSPHDATGVRDAPRASSATRASSTPRARRTALAGAAGLTGLGLVALAAVGPAASDPAAAAIVAAPIASFADADAFSMAPVGSYETGVFDQSAAEIVAHYAAEQRLLVVNAAAARVEVLDVADPAEPTKLFDLQTTGVLSSDGSVVPADAVANSVSVRADGLGAVAVESSPKTAAGWIVFFDAAGDGEALGAVRVGALPDMVAFSPDGTRLIVANEGEPADYYTVDPEGTISLIDAPATVSVPAQTAVRTADFHAFEADGATPVDPAVRIFGGRADAGTVTDADPLVRPVSENLEPEYATFSSDGSTAWVSLQEANALAIVDVATATVTEVVPLGTVDRSVVPFDPSDRDGADGGPAISIGTWPVQGYLMPDTIDSYEADGDTYIVTANEGDSRDWSAYSEVARVKDLGDDGLAPVCDSIDPSLLTDAGLGRLNITTANGLSADRSCYETLYTFGGRSFSILDAAGTSVFDSGDAFEQLLAEVAPESFNSNHTATGVDGRSDDKGPEPEGVALGEIDGRTYAFIGFERVGGIAVYDVTEPTRASFTAYVNNRDLSVSAEDEIDDGADPADVLTRAGDLGPEGLAFVSAADSPTGEPLLAVGNEVSGSTTMYAISVPAAVEPTVPPVDPSAPPVDPTVPPVDPTVPPTTEPGDGSTAVPLPTPTGDAGDPGVGSDGSGGAGDAADDGELAFTGSDTAWLVLPVGAALLALGTGLLLLARRRRAASK